MVVASKKDNIFILSGFIIVLMLVFFQMSYQTSYVSAVFTFSFFWIFTWFTRHLFSYNQSRQIFYVISCSLLSLIHVISFSPIGASFEYYNKLIMFICFLLFLYLCISLKVNKTLVIWIMYINILISILYVYFYFYGVQMDLWGFLTLNFTNPNLTGIFLAYSFLYVILFSISYKELNYSKWLLIVLIPLSVMLMYLIVQTYCRAALLTVVCFLVIIILDKLFINRIKIKSWVIVLWSLLPILFVIQYVALRGNITSNSFLVDEESGKAADTRMVVWGPSVDTVKENFLFGDYYGISNGTGKSQLHNTHLDVIASYGILPFILFVMLLYKSVDVSSKDIPTNFNKYSIWAFMVCFISGVFEAVLVAGGLCIYILACGFLLLANSKIKYESCSN